MSRFNHTLRHPAAQWARWPATGSRALGAAERFNQPERGNHAVRRVTKAWAVSTVVGNGEAGYADGEGAAARFSGPTAVVVDKEGKMVVADKGNQRLRRMTGRGPDACDGIGSRP